MTFMILIIRMVVFSRTMLEIVLATGWRPEDGGDRLRRREIARVVGPAEWDSPEAVAQFESIIATTRT